MGARRARYSLFFDAVTDERLPFSAFAVGIGRDKVIAV